MRISYWLLLSVVCVTFSCTESDDSETSTGVDTAAPDVAQEDTVEPDSQEPTDVVEADQGEPDSEPVVDTKTPTPEWHWTWANCRRALNAGTLSDDDKSKCDAHYKAVSAKHHFGLRWYFLGHDQQTVDSYPESQMDDVNTIYAPNEMSYFIQSRLRIVNPVAKEGSSGTTKFPISELISDIRQFLEVDEEDPQKVLDILIERLDKMGVDGLVAKNKPGGGPQPNAPEGESLITLETEWTSKQLHQTIARLNEEHISIFVRDAQGDKSTANFPRKGIQTPKADIVYLSVITELSALPHELGHFFGLPHTHGFWSSVPGGYQQWKASSVSSMTEDDWAHLQSLAGEDYSGTFTETYLPYDSTEKEIDGFESGHFLGRRVLAWAELTYVDDTTVASDAAFIALIKADTPPFLKNFVREKDDDAAFWGNNCGKSYAGDDQKTLRCKYGDDGDKPAKVLTGKDPLVADSLLFVDSTESNMMSYISTDTSDGVRRKIHLTTRQRDVIRLGTRAPSRQRLRNYALFE